MNRITLSLGFFTCIAWMVGCEPARSGNISVSLHNDSPQPVTAWITKTGDRNNEWLAPEDLAMVPKPELINGVVIPPGKTGDMGPMKGRFEGESVPVLRVYAGQMDIDHLLATSVDSQLRVDVVLDNGLNKLTVVNSAKLEVIPTPEK